MGSLKNSTENVCIVFLQEQDILDMIAQCEADEMDGKNMASNKIKGPKVRTINLIFLFQDENSGYLQTFCVYVSTLLLSWLRGHLQNHIFTRERPV